MTKKSKLPLGEVWRLITPYWTSPYERKRAYLCLFLLLAIVIGGSGLGAWFTGVNKDMVDAMEQRNASKFWQVTTMIFAVSAGMAVVAAANQWLKQWLEFRWRKALTENFINRWLDGNVFYYLERRQTSDNVDQRISEDCKLFVEKTIELSQALIGNLGTLAFMGYVLWNVATPLTIGPITIPGYMFFIAMQYGIFQVVAVHWSGHRLATLTMDQQRVEADFRFTLAQQREAAEQIALYRGGEVEKLRLGRLFESVGFNWGLLMSNYKRMTFVSQIVFLIASFVPMYALAPKLFSGEVTMGSMMQSQAAFASVAVSIAWFALRYSDLVVWSAVTRRLIGLNRSLDEPEVTGIEVKTGGQHNITTQGLSLVLPTGERLVDVGIWHIRGGERWLIRGPSGVGKSTLLRAIAGIWPYGKGEVVLPTDAKMLFLPQKSYIPTGPLKDALCYPAQADSIGDDACKRALIECRLPHLVDSLGEVSRWNQRLSGGEQQRLAFARALLAKPEFLFLDEATSALDEATESVLYTLIQERLVTTTIVSIGHNRTLDRYHGKLLELNSEKAPQQSALALVA